MMKRGEIYWVNLDPTKGSEIRKKRPCVVLSVTPINKARRTIIVVPLSTSAKAYPPITIAVNCMDKKVVAVCDQIRAIDKSRLLNSIGTINETDLEKIEGALRSVLAL